MKQSKYFLYARLQAKGKKPSLKLRQYLALKPYMTKEEERTLFPEYEQ